jgi:CRISPR/Cas system-associated endonuclease Cas1
VLGRLAADAETAAVRTATPALATAASLDQLVWAERDARCLVGVEVRFTATDARAVPEHWLSFGQRGSLLTGSPRLAINPAIAILNYLYAILEAETRLACVTVGLDPGLGSVHVGYRSRAPSRST